MMRKNLLRCVALALIVCLCGCGAGNMLETTAAPVEIEESLTEESFYEGPADTQAAATDETLEMEGSLYLTVSKITFSLVGESEEIYIGTVPTELVTWGSDDASVAVFRDGILTASGVGETTVFAEYGDQRVTCTVGCLARTREELESLDKFLLDAPKRMPPVVEEDVTGFFADSVIVGDSITYSLGQHERKYGLLGHPLFLARGSVSLIGFVRYVKNIYFRGAETKLEDALAQSGAKKAFFLLGQNDLGYRTVEEMIGSWETLVGRIREQSPDMEIYIQSCFLEWVKEGEDNSRNEKTVLYNEQLKQFAQEHDCYFVDVAMYAENHQNRMPTVYSLDQDVHLNEEGCLVWMQALLAYAQRQA